MYESWFRFRRRPFLAAPRSEDYFPSESSEHVRKTIISCVQRAAGPAVLIGGPGTGKTTSCLQLLSHFRTRTLVGFIPCTGISSRRSFLQNILFELDRPYRDLDDGELRLSLVEFLTSSEIPHEGTVLVFDDAHELSSEQFEDVSALAALLRDNSHSVHVILSGVIRLEELLSTAHLESFNQRIAARCFLEPFRIEETEAYIRRQFDRANAMADEVFIDDALPTIHKCTGGIPRLVNQLCDHALVLAAAGGHTQLNENGIHEAWSDLQQLPQPETNVAKPAIEDVVEFGALDDECSEDLECPITAEDRSRGRAVGDEDANESASDTRVDATPDAEQRLDDILGHLDDYQSLPYLGVSSAKDPFAEAFVDEEVVINRPATMLNRLADRQPEVVSDFGQHLIATLDQLLIPNETLDEHRGDMTSSTRLTRVTRPRLVVAAELGAGSEMDPNSLSAVTNHLSSEPAWGSPEPQEQLEERIGTNHQEKPTVEIVHDTLLSSRSTPQDIHLTEHPESGGYRIDVHCEFPQVETDPVVEYVPRTSGLEPTLSSPAKGEEMRAGPTVTGPSDAGASPLPEIVTISDSSPTLEAVTEITADDFAEAVPREPQEPPPASVRVVEVNRDDAAPSQPRRRFKQLFTDLRGNE